MYNSGEVAKAGTKALLTTLLWTALNLTIFMMSGCGGGGGNLVTSPPPAVLPLTSPTSSDDTPRYAEALFKSYDSVSVVNAIPQLSEQDTEPQNLQQQAGNTNYQSHGSWSHYSGGYVSIGSSGSGASTTWSVSGSRTGSVATEIANYFYSGKLSGTLVNDSDSRNIGAAVTGNVSAVFSPAKFWTRSSVDQLRIRFWSMQHRTHDGKAEGIRNVGWVMPGYGILETATENEAGAFAVLENGEVKYKKVVTDPNHRYAGYGIVNSDGTFSFSDVKPDAGDPGNTTCGQSPCISLPASLGNLARTRNADYGTMSGSFYGDSHQAIGATFTFSSSGKQVKGAFGAKK